MPRLDRLNSILYKEISTIIQFELNDPKVGFVTVSEVDIAPDLSCAKVYVSFLGKGYQKRDGLDALKRAKGFIKKELAHRVEMRKIPDLIFVEDDSIEKAARIEDIIKKNVNSI